MVFEVPSWRPGYAWTYVGAELGDEVAINVVNTDALNVYADRLIAATWSSPDVDGGRTRLVGFSEDMGRFGVFLDPFEMRCGLEATCQPYLTLDYPNQTWTAPDGGFQDLDFFVYNRPPSDSVTTCSHSNVVVGPFVVPVACRVFVQGPMNLDSPYLGVRPSLHFEFRYRFQFGGLPFEKPFKQYLREQEDLTGRNATEWSVVADWGLEEQNWLRLEAMGGLNPSQGFSLEWPVYSGHESSAIYWLKHLSLQETPGLSLDELISRWGGRLPPSKFARWEGNILSTSVDGEFGGTMLGAPATIGYVGIVNQDGPQSFQNIDYPSDWRVAYVALDSAESEVWKLDAPSGLTGPYNRHEINITYARPGHYVLRQTLFDAQAAAVGETMRSVAIDFQGFSTQECPISVAGTELACPEYTFPSGDSESLRVSIALESSAADLGSVTLWDSAGRQVLSEALTDREWTRSLDNQTLSGFERNGPWRLAWQPISATAQTAVEYGAYWNTEPRP